MSDLISRSALYKDIESRPYINKALAEIFETIIDEQTEVEAAPVVHGEWIHDINNLYGCSVCMNRETISPKKMKNFCPNCGAYMKGDFDD